MISRTVSIDGIPLLVAFSYGNAEPENGVPEDYDITAVYVLHAGEDIAGLLSEFTIERIVKELEKAKGEM